MTTPMPVTTAGSLTCSHGGQRVLSSGTKLTVRGAPVLLFSVAASALDVYVNCPFPPGGPPSPCHQTILDTPDSGSATRLTVHGDPVLLSDLRATTENPPTDPSKKGDRHVTVAAGQNKLTAS